MRDPVSLVLDEARGGSKRLLLTGWFSFRDGEVTAGDVLAQRHVSASLDQWGIAYDTAWSPGFAPGAMSLESADPTVYDRLLFVCGPLHGEQVVRLHHRFASSRRLAVDVTVVDPADPAVSGFHRVAARDGSASPPLPDLSTTAPVGAAPPVVGLALTYGQKEYGSRRRHGSIGDTLTRWLHGKDCATVEADTRLAIDDVRLCTTPEQHLALLSKLDLVLTTRLHGMVLALRVGTPVIAVDPVADGAKVSAQAYALRWPALLHTDEVTPVQLDRWWSWCLSPAGRAAAARRARLMGRRAALEAPSAGSTAAARAPRTSSGGRRAPPRTG
jgi:hypothetical protein